MRTNLPINQKKQFKYSITFSSWDEDSLEAGETNDRGFEVKDDTDTIGEILYLANDRYGIYYPLSFGGWESTEPEQDTDYWEKGINKYYTLHITNTDGTDITQEENDFITFLLSNGRYEINKFREYAIGGIVGGAIAVGIGGLIAYYYFKNKKPKSQKAKKVKKSVKSESSQSTTKKKISSSAKSVTHIINGKKRKFPIKDAWRKEHNVENQSENYEVPQEDRFAMGGDASEHYYEVEYGEGGVARAKEVIMKKIGYNEETADYFVGKSEKFAIWLADSILKDNLKYRNYTKEQWLNTIYATKGNINSNYGGAIREILDWLQHPVTPKQELKQLSFDQALEKAREWHRELQVLGGDIDFTEPEKNTILKKYPKNDEGVEYYWVFIPSNYCDLESSRMGHCGRTGYGNKLISLRSVKPYGKGHTISDSHVTIAYSQSDNDIENNGIFYQVKGKKNNKPAEKYFPYIFDLIKSILNGEINQGFKEENDESINVVEHLINLQKKIKQEIVPHISFHLVSPSSTEMKFLKGELSNSEREINWQSFINVDSPIYDNFRTIYKLKEKQNEVRNNREYEEIQNEIDRLREETKTYYKENIVDKFKEIIRLSNLQKESEKILMYFQFNGFGSEYGDNEDYGYEDMTNEELRELYELKPDIFNDSESIFAIYDAGVITSEELKTLKDGNQEFDTFGNQMKLYERGIILEQPSTIVQLNVTCDRVGRYLDLGNDFSDDLVENILCGDIDDYNYDNWSYYYDNPKDLVDNLNNENEQRVIDEIVRITGLDKSVVEENGIEHYLGNQDKDFPSDDFDTIIRALASAQNNADNSDYHNYLYKNIKSALEELGEVNSLNDEGAEITIDLSNLMSEEDIASQMDYYEFTDIVDLFDEELSRGNIDLPKLRIDDRYSPYGSREDFNDSFSDTDLESGYAKGGSLRPKTLTKKTKIKNMKPSQRKLAKGGNIETGISKEDYFLVVHNWVYFTFNYPMGFVKDAFSSSHLSDHLQEKFSSSYTRYGSVGVLMSFWANLDNKNRRILSLWIKNNYFSSSDNKSKLLTISDDDYAKIISHWNTFCFNFPYGFKEQIFGDNLGHYEHKWIRAYESAGATGVVNKFFTELSMNNQRLLTDWVYDNYKGITFADGGDVYVAPHKKAHFTWIMNNYGFVIPNGEDVNYTMSDFAKDIKKTYSLDNPRNKEAYDYVNKFGDIRLFNSADMDKFERKMSELEVEFAGGGELLTHQSFFIVDKNGVPLGYKDGYILEFNTDNLLRNQEDWEGETSDFDVVSEKLLLDNNYNFNDVNGTIYYDVTKGENIVFGEELKEPYRSFYLKQINKNSFAGGGRVTTNDGIIEAFLTSNRELKVGNLSTHYNQYDNQMLLRNFYTLIATRKGDDVQITNTKYSKTTTIITNKVKSMALNNRMNVKYVDKFADGGLVVKNDSDLQEVAKYMTNAVKKHRWDLKDLIHYFEKENNFDYKQRVKIWEEMNGYEMPKTYNNIYEMLKRISEANGSKFADGGEAGLYSKQHDKYKFNVGDRVKVTHGKNKGIKGVIHSMESDFTGITIKTDNGHTLYGFDDADLDKFADGGEAVKDNKGEKLSLGDLVKYKEGTYFIGFDGLPYIIKVETPVKFESRTNYYKPSIKEPIEKIYFKDVPQIQGEIELIAKYNDVRIYADGGQAGKEKTINSKGAEYIITLVPTGDFTDTYNLSIARYSDEFGGSNHSVMQILSKIEAERMFQKVNESNAEDMYRVFAKMPTHKNKKFADGGSADLDYNEIFNVLKSKIDDAMDDIPNKYESASQFTGEEIEHESRSGFIPYTDGGYQAVWIETLGALYSSGYNLPTKPLDDEMNRQIDYNLELARESFGSDYPEIVEELGEENIDYNSLVDAGYQDEAEEFSNAEMDMMWEDTILMRILANYYNPENSRAKDGKHTIRLFGDVNLESPYHRTGNLDDSHEYEFTFNSIAELESEMNKGLKQVIAWFEGEMYNDSTAEMKVRRMKKGGSTKYAKGGILGESARLEYITDAFASDDLQQQLRDKLGIETDSLGENYVISFAYTDYGGDFLDKVAIEYFQETYPENTLVEATGWGGQNAYVFGEPAKEWIETTEDYPLGFEDIEDFYYEKQNEQEAEDFNYFLDEITDDYNFDREEAFDWLMENKGGYYGMTTQGLDFSYEDLTNELVLEGIIEPKEEDEDEYAKGGGVKSPKDIFAEYEENEGYNRHSENVVLLAKNFGSEQDVKDAKAILKKHIDTGHLTDELRKRRNKLDSKLYPKLIEALDNKYAGGGSVEEIIENINPIATKFEGNSRDGFSVMVEDANSNFKAWVDVYIDDNDVRWDWNQYIFHTDNSKDVFQSKMQDDMYVADYFSSEAINYLEQQGAIQQDEKAHWSYTDKYEDGGEAGEYSEEVDKILENLEPEAVKFEGNSREGFSVLVKDKNSDFNAWVDVYMQGSDVTWEWNQYIFARNNSDDMLKSELQDNIDIADYFSSEAINYLEQQGAIQQDENADWSYTDKYKDGGTTKKKKLGAEKKSKIEITEDKKEGKKYAKRTLVKENNKGEKITYELSVGIHTNPKEKPNRYADGFFEIYATDEDDNEYFYAEGGLWIKNGRIYDYDGVYELSEKLRPLMSALNLNAKDVYAEGGKVGMIRYYIGGLVSEDIPFEYNGEEEDINYEVGFHEGGIDLETFKETPSGYYVRIMPYGSTDIRRFIYPEKDIEIAYLSKLRAITMLLFEADKDTKENQKIAIKEGKKNLPKLLKYMTENLEEEDRFSENVRKVQDAMWGGDEDEDEYAEGGEVDILKLYQKDVFSDKDSELIDEAIENGDIDTTDIKEDFMGYVYDRIDKEYKDEFETEDIWEYTDEQYENLLTHKENYKKLISFLKNEYEYAEGGEAGDYYEQLAVYVQGVGSIYNGTSMKKAVEKANSYLKKNKNAEIVIVDEKYGDEYDLDGNMKEEYAGGGRIDKMDKFISELAKKNTKEFSVNEYHDFRNKQFGIGVVRMYFKDTDANFSKFDTKLGNALNIDFETQGDSDNYAGGGEVEDWMEEALDSLMEETGSTDLEISYVSDNGNSFYATDNNLEYRVFKSEDDAEETAIEQVREDLEESPENFNQDWLMNYIDGGDFFEEALNEMNQVYVDDIESESDSVYENRLIAELVENGLMDEEDAKSDYAEPMADDLKSDYVALLTEGQLDEGNNGLNYFIYNFGEEETYKMVRDNNLIDIDEASKDAVNVDGIGHFLSSYDGETLYLSNDCVAYRTN